MKIVLIGAGSAMFTVGVVSDLIKANLAAELALGESGEIHPGFDPGWGGAVARISSATGR